jgi:hypothetical protein
MKWKRKQNISKTLVTDEANRWRRNNGIHDFVTPAEGLRKNEARNTKTALHWQCWRYYLQIVCSCWRNSRTCITKQARPSCLAVMTLLTIIASLALVLQMEHDLTDNYKTTRPSLNSITFHVKVTQHVIPSCIYCSFCILWTIQRRTDQDKEHDQSWLL